MAKRKQKPKVPEIVAHDWSIDPKETALQAMESLLRGLADRTPIWTVWSDFLCMGSISIANAVDVHQRDVREAEYLACAKRYTPEQLDQFAKCLAHLNKALEAHMCDVLGTLHQRLELHNIRNGQYFTPWVVAEAMARMTWSDTGKMMESHEYITACEPAVGSGVMMIALASAMKAEGINYQERLCVTAIDNDITAVHMAYLQLSLLGIPAQVIHGDSLSGECWSTWLTPFYIMGGFWWKERRRAAKESIDVPAAPAAPAYGDEVAAAPAAPLFSTHDLFAPDYDEKRLAAPAADLGAERTDLSVPTDDPPMPTGGRIQLPLF